MPTQRFFSLVQSARWPDVLARVTPLHGLAMMLLMLHAAVLLAGPAWVRALTLAHYGLFLLWQPVVRRDVALDLRLTLVLLGLGALLVLSDSSWVMAAWLVLLTGLLGTLAASAENRAERVAYRLALAYVVAVQFSWVLPHSIGVAVSHGFEFAVRFGLVGLPLVIVFLPARGHALRVSALDSVYGVFLSMLVSLIALAVFALMTITQAGYAWALAQGLVGVALLLLALNWLWSPHAGFGGIGVLASRYVLSVGLPFERLAGRLAALAERSDTPESLIRDALETVCERDWLCGVQWRTTAASGSVGGVSAHHSEFVFHGLTVRWFSVRPLTPALALHLRLLTQLIGFFQMARAREQTLRELAYSQSLAETGAQLTHDMKNIVQSMDALLAAVEVEPVDDASPLARLLRRQLPQLSERLAQTLARLQHPQNTPQPTVAAWLWWEALRARYADDGVEFVCIDCTRGDPGDAAIPLAVFDSVADNLLANALRKRRVTPGVAVRVQFGIHPLQFVVSDDGAAVPRHVVARLFAHAVASESGQGVGLFLAARLARRAGFELALAENRSGRVTFCLTEGEALPR